MKRAGAAGDDVHIPFHHGHGRVVEGHDQHRAAQTGGLTFRGQGIQQLAEVVRPALADGKDVLCDRFTDATYAYQGGGRGVGIERIAVLEFFVQRQLRPNITFLLDAPTEIASGRARNRGESDRIEAENLAFFNRARQIYLQRAAREPSRFHVIDATRPVQDIQAQLAETIERILR